MLNDAPLTIEQKDGGATGTRVFVLSGPLTLRNIFTFQDEFRRGELNQMTILDLRGVPYMDSAGLGAVVNAYTHAQRLGTRLVLANVNDRVMELFRLTKVHTVIPMASSLEDAYVIA